MKIIVERICGPARGLLELKGHSIIYAMDAMLQDAACIQGEVLWTHLNRVDVDLLSRCPQLKAIACPCTDVSHINIAECQRRNIKVLSLRDTDVLPSITATAEHTIGLILALVRKIPAAVNSVNDDHWDRYRFIGRELSSMTVGIWGHGRIGKTVCNVLSWMGAKCFLTADICKHIPDPDRCDIITIHVDLNETSRGMCNAAFFAATKPGSYFVNTSRGAVVDESALLAALRSGHLAGAALDVVCCEPDQINPELIAYARENPDRLIITPHIGGCAVEAIEKAEVALAARLVDFLAESRLA